jgi:hypothetical protein
MVHIICNINTIFNILIWHYEQRQTDKNTVHSLRCHSVWLRYQFLYVCLCYKHYKVYNTKSSLTTIAINKQLELLKPLKHRYQVNSYSQNHKTLLLSFIIV